MLVGLIIGAVVLVVAACFVVKIAEYKMIKKHQNEVNNNKNEKTSQEKPFEEKELLDNKEDKSAENVRIVPEMTEVEYEADNKTIKIDKNGQQVKKEQDKKQEEPELTIEKNN